MAMTYQEAREMMRRARNGRRKLENNTWLEERYCQICAEDGSPQNKAEYHLHSRSSECVGCLAPRDHHDFAPNYVIRLHDTDVVTLHPDGSYMLSSGGWRTVTTKDRINRYAPVALYSVRKVWWVRPRWAGNAQHSENANSVAVRFEDGMRVNSDGVRIAGTENPRVIGGVELTPEMCGEVSRGIREIVKTWNWHTDTAAHNPQYLPSGAFGGGMLQPWALLHVAAMSYPGREERPVVEGIRSWLLYAQRHHEAYGSTIGEDYFLGDHWAAWGFALMGLLNGATGRLDYGTLDAILRDTLEAEGWDTDAQERRS